METTIEITEKDELKIVTPQPEKVEVYPKHIILAAKVEAYPKHIILAQIENLERTKAKVESDLALWNQRKTDAENLGINFNE